MPNAKFDAVDHLLALDPGRRGIAAFFEVGGARRAAEALAHGHRVVITTGFIVEPKVAETDGPPGAASRWPNGIGPSMICSLAVFEIETRPRVQ